MFEDFTDTLVGLCRALEILISTDLLANFLTLHQNVRKIGNKRIKPLMTIEKTKALRNPLNKTYLLRSNRFLAGLV